MGWFDRILFPQRRGAADFAYQKAMGVSSDLIQRMRENSASKDPARAVMADIWQQSHNVPFMVSVIETVQEAKAGIMQKPEDNSLKEQ